MEKEESQVLIDLKQAAERLETLEKRSSQIDEQLDGYNEQLTEERNRSMVASMDADQVKHTHHELCEQVSISEVAITKLESELADKRRQLTALEECSDLEMVFGRRDRAHLKEDYDLSQEVAKLEDWKLSAIKAEKRRLKSAAQRSRVPEPTLQIKGYNERMGQFKRKLRVNDCQWKTADDLKSLKLKEAAGVDHKPATHKQK
jgi:chromosome segregation ATPase